MTTILDRLKEATETGTMDQKLMEDTAKEFRELRKHVDHMEELLIILVRTGWPWNDDGTPNEILHTAKEGFGAAMQEARELMQLDRSRLTRTEPKT